uniref:Protein kinase domain-containing protein n=1 Tax=Arcella intermedia TaxID=1963864 RepID=A0A6B2LSW3_9EUKA
MAVMLWESITSEPPYMEFPPIRALFEIVTKGIPPLPPSLPPSAKLVDFFSKCVEMDHTKRSTPADLLEHPFCKTSCTPDHFAILIHQARSCST